MPQLTNLAGAITDSYAYDAFGNLLSSIGATPNDFGYRGEQYDQALGLQYLHARYYNPPTGEGSVFRAKGDMIPVPPLERIGVNP